MRRALRAVVAQFTTMKGINGLICAGCSGIGLYSLIMGRMQIGILWLLVSEIRLLRMEIEEKWPK